jgi:folate-binding protein YgfZ
MTETPPLILNGVATLSHLGVIRVEGEDAARFLHGQLTQDFTLLGLSEARLAAFCSAKGRMQASFIGFKQSPTDILLVCSRDILSTTLKRLGMFVLRAKARLSDVTGDYQLLGLCGSALESIAKNDHSTLGRVELNGGTLVWLHPAGTQARALWVAPVGTPQPAGPVLETADWQWGEVRSGVATLTPPIMDAFVPQMLNYESVGGVNFKKGCYPGQEVVARSQYRGTLKRRAFLVHGDEALQAGQEIFTSAHAGQPCGMVAQAAAVPGQSGYDAIVSLQISAAEAGDLHLGSATGTALNLLPLPYALLEEV